MKWYRFSDSYRVHSMLTRLGLAPDADHNDALAEITRLRSEVAIRHAFYPGDAEHGHERQCRLPVLTHGAWRNCGHSPEDHPPCAWESRLPERASAEVRSTHEHGHAGRSPAETRLWEDGYRVGFREALDGAAEPVRVPTPMHIGQLEGEHLRGKCDLSEAQLDDIALTARALRNDMGSCILLMIDEIRRLRRCAEALHDVVRHNTIEECAQSLERCGTEVAVSYARVVRQLSTPKKKT